MQLMIDSPFYYVVDLYAADSTASAGIEIIDKVRQREVILYGAVAEDFRKSLSYLAQQQPDLDLLEDFMEPYKPLMHQPLHLH